MLADFLFLYNRNLLLISTKSYYTKNKIKLSVRNFPPRVETHKDKQIVNATTASWGKRRSRFVLRVLV